MSSEAPPILESVNVESITLRKFKPEGRPEATYYVNPSPNARRDVEMQIGNSEIKKEEMPFAALNPSAYKDQNPDRPSLLLALPNEAMQNKIKEIDDKIAEMVHAQEILKPGASLDYVKDMQTSLLKYPKKEGGNIGLSIKMNRTGKYRTDVARLVVNKSGKLVYKEAAIDDITKDTIVFINATISPVWIRGKEWGVSLNANNALIISPGETGNRRRNKFVIQGQVVGQAEGSDEDESHESPDGADVDDTDASRKRERNDDEDAEDNDTKRSRAASDE